MNKNVDSTCALFWIMNSMELYARFKKDTLRMKQILHSR